MAVVEGPEDPLENLANATLLSAAPDLFRELKALATSILEVGMAENRRLIEAGKAIAKAEGRPLP